MYTVLSYYLGRYDHIRSYPKFRYTGKVDAGGDWTSGGIIANLDTKEINSDAVVNGGIFLCMRPGFYHFSAALSSHAPGKQVGLHIMHNSKYEAYAR